MRQLRPETGLKITNQIVFVLYPILLFWLMYKKYIKGNIFLY